MHRRHLITGLPAIWLAASPHAIAAPPRGPTVEEMIADLARRLNEMHGGQWACRYDDKLLMMKKT